MREARDERPEDAHSGWVLHDQVVRRPASTIAARTSRRYFDQFEPGLVGDDFCPRRKEICGVGASGQKTYNGTDPATPGLLRRLERVCRAHPKRVESCVPPERLLSIRLAADAGEVAKLAPFVGCPNSSAAIADVWAANGPQGHQRGFEHRGEVVQVTPGTSRPEGPRTRSRADRRNAPRGPARAAANAKAANEMFRLRANAAIGHIDAGRLEQAKALLDADLDPAPRA